MASRPGPEENGLGAGRLSTGQQRITTSREPHQPCQGKGTDKDTRPRETSRPFSPDLEWDMRVDLNKQLQFPTEIITTSLRPDIVVWSNKARAVHLNELTVPSEEGIEAAYERKKAKYSELAAECREAGLKSTIYSVEVGCPRLHGAVNHTPPEGRRSGWRKAEEGHKGAGRGGRERQLVAQAEEEGQELGKEHLTPTTAARGNYFQLQAVTGRRPCHCSATRRRSSD